MKDLRIDVKPVKQKLVCSLKEEFRKRGFERAVVGVSGGVDSALVTVLAVKALGAKNVTCLYMPYHYDNSAVAEEIKDFVSGIRSEFRIVDISPMIDAYFGREREVSPVRRGNKMARERMSILYDQSKILDALVLGTGNKTEALLGYFTLYGDSGAAINPIGALYKTQVWQLAKSAGVPKNIVERTPSAGLWPGQTDEGEMGVTYKEVDRLLFYMVDRRYRTSRLKGMGFPVEFINKVRNRIKSTEFKRRLPTVLKI